MSKKFDARLADAQATYVLPVKPENFDFGKYESYCATLNQTCLEFWKLKSGVAVYRRMRVGECFSFGCRDMKRSLELQLGALEKSMLYQADIPNFLEPWYGIGTLAGAFGGDYFWPEGNAPVLKPDFSSIDELLASESKEVANTKIGRHTLDMIEYFMDQTKGRLPISFTELKLKGLKMADGAFSQQTDPGATDDLEAFHGFANTGIVLNARIVGDLQTIRSQISRLWKQGMKLVVVSYCETPEEQKKAYELIHNICR
jgi:hypothetical protein